MPMMFKLSTLRRDGRGDEGDTLENRYASCLASTVDIRLPGPPHLPPLCESIMGLLAVK